MPTIVMMQEVARPLSVDERTLVLATAVSIDFDYFSQHSHGSGLGFMPWLMPIPTPSPSYPEDGDAGAPPADVPPGGNLFDAASSVLHLYISHLPFSDGLRAAVVSKITPKPPRRSSD